MGVKEKTLRRIFTGFILRIGIEIIIGGLIVAALFIFALDYGYILPANYSEQYAKKVMEQAQQQDYAGDFIDNIQDYVTYYWVDDGGIVTRSNRSRSTGKTFRIDTKNSFLTGRKYYLKETFIDGTLYLEYYVRSCYPSTFLNHYFLCPAYATGLFVFLMILFIVILNIRRLERLFQQELRPLGEAAERISIDNLDVEIAHSKVMEVQRVVDSFLKMKDELTDSLEREWKAQQNRRAQIAALAHDLKTPLTVILGNLDLLSETGVTEEQRQMIETSIEEVKHSEDYIGILVDMVKNTGVVEIERVPIELKAFFLRIENQAQVLCENKNIQLQVSYKLEEKAYPGDQGRLERAIMNLISNAIDYSPNNGLVELDVVLKDSILSIAVRDQGSGFSEEMLRSGVGLFKMGDSSRSSKRHYGIGLYMVENTAKLHNGRLLISNRKEGGAEAKIILK